jgi:gamma-glutamyltranspeptidase/glutathione hydrolase
MATGVGGDAFALVWRDGELGALDAAGPAPRRADRLVPVADRGPRSVTVPGAVAGWAALADAYGRLGLDRNLADAIDVAERGFAVTPRTADAWAHSPAPRELSPAPRVGELVRQPELARTLRRIADDGPSAFYGGEIAASIASVTWVEEEDLGNFRPRWVEPLRVRYRDVDVLELPPPTQGVAALEALALLELVSPELPNQVRCVALALEDALARVRDHADVGDLLERDYLERRIEAETRLAAEPAHGTVYLCAVDGDRMAVSFIQSLYNHFGSGIVAPGTGVVLQNRGACFHVSGAVEPGRRPFHTIIPGMLLREDRLLGPFGVMGGLIQAQAHVQLVSALVDDGLDPQAALDRPRFRIDGDLVRLESGLWEREGELRRLGYRATRDADEFAFGGGQVVLVLEDALAGGSDARKDGYAGGF